MFLKSDDIQPLVNLARFLVAPLQRKAKDSKILISKRNQDFLFSHKTQIQQYRLDDEVYELRDQEQ